MNHKIKTAILGFGRSGAALHAPPLQKIDDYDICAVSDVSDDRLAKAKDELNCRTYNDYHQMLKEEELDLVCIITRSDQHCQMTCDCLEAGCNVLVTKPWCLNEAEARRMIATAEKSGKRLIPWHPSRWGCDFARIKEIVAEGTIGKVFCVRRAEYTFASRNDWQTEKKYGGGYLLNWAPHIVEPPLLLMNSPVKLVFGHLGKVINPGDAEDTFFTVLKLENGSTIRAEYNISAAKLPRWVVQADRGTIVVNDNVLTLYTGNPVTPDDPTQKQDMDSKENHTVNETITGALFGDANIIYKELARVIKGEIETPVTTDSALYLTQILDAIRMSHEENRVVEL